MKISYASPATIRPDHSGLIFAPSRRLGEPDLAIFSFLYQLVGISAIEFRFIFQV